MYRHPSALHTQHAFFGPVGAMRLLRDGALTGLYHCGCSEDAPDSRGEYGGAVGARPGLYHVLSPMYVRL